MAFRISKLLLVASIGLYMLVVFFNNTTDYGSNFNFVSHVLSMDDTFPGNQGKWRAISHPVLHHLFYILIILTEAVIAFLCLGGAFRMWRKRQADQNAFHQSKTLAIYGLTLGILLWFTGFITVGGEWFLMWQSQNWNGIQSAFQNAAIFLLALLFLKEKGD